jgi:hypothetical protein
LEKLVAWAFTLKLKSRFSSGKYGFFDSPITMIGLGGLLLVIPHQFAVLISVLWVGWQKFKYLKFDVRNIFAGPHTEPWWGCSTKK